MITHSQFYMTNICLTIETLEQLFKTCNRSKLAIQIMQRSIEVSLLDWFSRKPTTSLSFEADNAPQSGLYDGNLHVVNVTVAAILQAESRQNAANVISEHSA